MSPRQRGPVADVEVQKHSTIFLFVPHTTDGENWLLDHCPEAMWTCGAMVVEHRFALEIAAAITLAGLTLC